MEMSDLLLNPAMCWKMFKSLLDEIDLCVDVASVYFFMHVDTLHSLFYKCLGPMFLKNGNVEFVLDSCYV